MAALPTGGGIFHHLNNQHSHARAQSKPGQWQSGSDQSVDRPPGLPEPHRAPTQMDHSGTPRVSMDSTMDGFLLLLSLYVHPPNVDTYRAANYQETQDKMGRSRPRAALGDTRPAQHSRSTRWVTTPRARDCSSCCL